MNGTISRFRISTDGFEGPDALEAFRETLGRAILQLEINPIDGIPLNIDMSVRSLTGLGIAFGRFSPTRNHHTPSLIANDDLVLVVITSGSRSFLHAKREGTVVRGEAVLTRAGEAGTFFGQWSSTVAFRLSRDMLASRIQAPDDAVGRVIPAKSPLLRYMLDYAQLLEGHDAISPAGLGRSIITHTHELAALLLAQQQDAGVLSRAEGVRAARLQAIKADIVRNVTHPTLTLDEIARRHQISRSYVSQLLAEAGTTFTELVLNERLALAHQLLTDRRELDKTISAIAYQAGFSDLSYFNRSFRRKFGATPSDVRGA